MSTTVPTTAPILAISVEVFGLLPQSGITMVTIALVAVLATLIALASVVGVHAGQAGHPLQE